jgi:hypothetical protein
MVSIQKVYQWTPSADNETSSSFLEVTSGLFGFKFRRRWSELEQNVPSSRSRDCRSRLGVPETSYNNSYNVTSPTPSTTSSVAMGTSRVSDLCDLATGCTGKRRITAVEKRRRKSRSTYKFDRESISHARTKSLPLPKRQHVVPLKTGDTGSYVTLTRQPTPSAQHSQKIVPNKPGNLRRVEPSIQITANNSGDLRYVQKPIIIHKRAASMESIQQVFDFYDDEDTSNEDDQHRHHESEGPTFELIDIVEPSESPPEGVDCRNGPGLGMQERKLMLMRNISPSLPLENEDRSQECDCGTEDESRHRLRSPELVRLATMRGRQRRILFGQGQADGGSRSSKSSGEQPGLSARYERRYRTVSMSSVSVLSCSTTRTVLSRSRSCSCLLKPEEISGLPSGVLTHLLRSSVYSEPLKSVSPLKSREVCLACQFNDADLIVLSGW